MCGILVVLSKTGPVAPEVCRRALSTMSWRGPDFAYSRVWENRLFLGQTVLSITGDPREGITQYHRSPGGRYEVLYNGEIYNADALNAQFLAARPGLTPRLGTDTEVLVNLHEVLPPGDVPPELDGMYAYALFDTQARRLHLARDVQGEKSLYIFEDERWVVVASEIRAIQAVLPSIALDPQALRDYFRTRHLMLFGRTVYEGIRELSPGRLDTLDLDTFTWSTSRASSFRDWVDPQRMLENRNRSVDSLVDELNSLLARCVREMIPREHRYAAVVSGGVDSSILGSYLVTLGQPDVLVAVNNVGKDRISNDLSGFERTLGRSIQTLKVDAAAYAAEIPRCQEVCGSPLPSHSFVPQSQQSAFVRAAGCRVLLGGEGADELFGGYPVYLTGSKTNGRFCPSPYTAHQVPLVEFVDDAPDAFQQDLADAWTDAREAYGCVENDCERTLLAMMYCDAAYQLSGVGLRGSDLMSMMWSVETRSVYLRRPIVQFALNLPAAMKANGRDGIPELLRTKPLLKHLFLRQFSADLLVEKQGFSGFPNDAAAWLGAPADYESVAHLGVEPESIEAAWSDPASAWKLINVEYFIRGQHARA